MAGSATRKEKSGKKGKKRKLTSSEDTAKPSKESRKNEEGCAVEERKAPANMEVEGETTLNIKDGLQWRNLELVLLIQSKELNAHKRVELIFDFVNSRANKEEKDTFEDFNILSMSQLILHTSSWIQSLLITSERKFRATNKESEESQLCLDYRCWEVLKFCLKESSRLNISLSLSRDLLKVISCVSRSALDSINSVGKDSKESIFTCMEFQFYNTVSDCINFLFSSYGRLLNGNLDLWAVAVRSMLELLIKIYGDNLQDNDVGILMTQFSCLVLDPFSKFLRVHPGRKNGFRDFVDKLLEPLLHVLGLLHDQIRDSYPVSQQNLFKLVEEILAYGLFHSVHLDEYLSFQSTEKYSSSADGKLETTKTMIKSYHRHLFDKLEILISEKKVQALSGIGEMLRLFVDCVNKHKRDSLEAETSKLMECRSTKHHTKIDNLTSEKSDHKITASSDMRKSIINFFVLTLEPLLLDLTKHLQSDLQIETSLLDVYYVLKSVNKILSIMMHERVYVRMEGSFGEACLNFFKIIYGLLLSCHVKFNKLWQSICRVDKFPQVEIVNSLAREFILVVANFLETEYEVIGDDLVNTWLMILTLLEIAHSSTDPSLFSGTVDLGCQVLHLYSELRQVNHAVFTLCRGLRHLPFYQGDKFDKSGCLLLCSQKFRLAISNAIKSIPEGQVSGCVKTLSDEISDTLAWMKVGYSVTDEYEFGGADSCKFTTQAEIFGMVLSEIYSRVLDFLSITAGNSYLTGVSVKKLVLILRASISHLISPEQNGGDEFLFSVTGITFQTNNEECKSYFQDKIPMFVLFFFRLYVSCRSLYRQSVSLMPPDSSRKMSAAIADFHTAYSGQDCINRTDFEDEGYFSWIGLSSTSFLSVVQFIKGSFLQEGSTDYSCLIYVMHMMAFQRIADLDRQIQSVEYIVQTSKNVIHSKLIDDADLLSLHDNKRKQEMYLSGLKQEAVNITGFIMEYLSLVDEKQLLSMLSGRTPKISSSQYMEFDTWDLGVCTVNEKTLPIAFWWIICQNVDTWCNHATKKKLKLFLSLLILNSLPHGSCGEFEKHTRNPGDEMNVTKYQISLEHLRDTNLYDQRIVRRYIASKLCSILKKFASLLFKDPTNIDVELSSSDWEKVLRVLNSSSRTPRDNPVTYCIYSDLIEGCCNQQTSFSPIRVPVAACRSLLDLLCQMMEISLSFKSFSRCVMYLVNFERLVVRSLLDPHGTLCLHQHLELLSLLVSCRRTLKYLLMAFCEEKLEASKSLNLPIFSGSSSLTLWFLESVNLVVAWWNSLSSEYNGGQVNDMIFSLMDHTSCVFLTLSKHQFGLAIKSVQRPRSTIISSLDSRSNHSNESDCCMKSLEDVDACKSLSIVVGTLENQMKSFLLLLKEAFTSGSGEAGIQRSDLNKLCSLVSCVQGFLWGLESAVNDVGANGGDLKAKLMKRQHKTISRINNFAELFVQFIGTSSRIFLHTDQPLKISCDGLGQLNLDHDNADTWIGGLTDFGSFNHDCLRTDLLQSFLSGQNLESAFLLRGLFSACSAIVRLSMQIGCSSLPSNLIQFFLGCSEVLLVKFSGMVDMPKPLSFVWLDGTIKYLEALGGQFSSISPATRRDIYTKLVELHLKAIGRCISLQGKEATLASHDIESSAKFSQGQVSESTVSDSLYGLSDIKAKLRMSFKVFIEKPSELHFLSALQALERALVGVREGCTTIYEVQMENSDGGKVSSMVAAGVDCLDLILEFIKGHKQLKLVSGNLKTLTASLLNVIVHLQGPSLFYMKPNSVAVNKNPDSGSVVVMCVEVLTRVAGKPALLRLDSHHVAQSLHIPATLFQGFGNLKAGKSSHPSLLGFMDSKESEHLESSYLVDRQFSINLYTASCRLLWTVVKHHKSECVRCIALLQYSIQALLHSLEIADSADRNGYFAWQLEEGIKCASYLRRVYEEIRQQKDVLGRHCFMFLSDYIWLYSGHGPLKRGIKRELDEALRPGVYALIDVCSADDLQYLHTVFGEGPCRSTLASLQHDYKLHFQYEGKV